MPKPNVAMPTILRDGLQRPAWAAIRRVTVNFLIWGFSSNYIADGLFNGKIREVTTTRFTIWDRSKAPTMWSQTPQPVPLKRVNQPSRKEICLPNR